MRYVFDFGDNWQFKVELESIDPPNRTMKHPKIIESHGKPHSSIATGAVTKLNFLPPKKG